MVGGFGPPGPEWGRDYDEIVVRLRYLCTRERPERSLLPIERYVHVLGIFRSDWLF